MQLKSSISDAPVIALVRSGVVNTECLWLMHASFMAFLLNLVLRLLDPCVSLCLECVGSLLERQVTGGQRNERGALISDTTSIGKVEASAIVAKYNC